MPSGTALEADVCVVGSGPVGTSIAAELARASLRVCLLEGGGREYEPESQAPYAFESVGHPWGRGPFQRRVRVLGGTSTLWTGRCAPFDPIDFTERAWIPHSGWPIARSELDGYLDRAGPLLGLGPQIYDDAAWARFGVDPPSPPLDPSLLRMQLWQYSRGEGGGSTHFARDVLARLEGAQTLTVIVHANVTRVLADEGAARGVEARTLEGTRLSVRAPTVILACGAIENARLLLVSEIGNEHDQVGRYLLDHLSPTLGIFDPGDAPRLLDRFGHYWLDDERGRHVFYAGVALSERVQRSRRLPSCTASLLVEPRDDAPLLALRRIAKGGGTPRDVARVCGAPLELARAAMRRTRHRPEILPMRTLSMIAMIEQMPDPESRVTLSTKKDVLGVPIARVDWRVHTAEREAARTMFRLLERELPRIGMPEPRPAPWILGEEDFLDRADDIAHAMGTTRMSRDPRSGVVDQHCAVHGVRGLYLGGGSVFPTGGTANPTLMYVALALRLADHVKSRVRRGGPRWDRPAMPSASGSTRS